MDEDLNDYIGKNTALYTLATKDWLLWELLLEVYWQVRIE